MVGTRGKKVRLIKNVKILLFAFNHISKIFPQLMFYF